MFGDKTSVDRFRKGLVGPGGDGNLVQASLCDVLLNNIKQIAASSSYIIKTRVRFPNSLIPSGLSVTSALNKTNRNWVGVF